jgi:hypothetical protein
MKSVLQETNTSGGSPGRRHTEGVTTVFDARAEYFAANDFGDDGGYSKSTVTIYLFGIPISFPNTEGRKKAVVFHDMHHLVTGYATDNVGEAEIGAWELGSGCTQVRAALVLNTGALLLGVFRSPRKVFAAFVRGRQCSNLYGADARALLDREVDDVARELGLDRPLRPATLGDGVRFAGYLLASLASVALPLTLIAWAVLRFV